MNLLGIVSPTITKLDLGNLKLHCFCNLKSCDPRQILIGMPYFETRLKQKDQK